MSTDGFNNGYKVGRDSDRFLFQNLLEQQGGFPLDTVPISNIRTAKEQLQPEQLSFTLENMNSGSVSSDDSSTSQYVSGTSGNGVTKPGYDSNMSDFNANGTRKYHNKSRNGCATCKKRRVKCDETHPVCNKCEHMKIECVYLPVLPKVRRTKKEILAEKALKLKRVVQNKVEHQVDQVMPELLPQPLQQNLTLPSIKVEQFSPLPESPSNLASLANIGSSIASLLSLLNSPLSSILSLASPLLNLSTMERIKKEIMAHPELADLATLHGGLTPSLIQQLMLLLQGTQRAPQISVTSQDQQPPVTPLQIQQKIKEAQDYQKERAKEFQEYATKSGPELSPSVTSPVLSSQKLSLPPLNGGFGYSGTLNMLDLRLMYHYTTKVWPTITALGISEERIWSEDIPMLLFNYPFLMHSILLFSATHLSRTERGLDQCVTCHRGDLLRLLRELVLEISPENTDALVLSLLILIMDSLLNASLPTSTSPKSLPASAWIFHVKGAATILTAVWPLNESSRFYKFIGVDLEDLGDINKRADQAAQDGNRCLEDKKFSDLQCFDEEVADLYPVPYNSPYLVTLLYLEKLHRERYKSDFILRIFLFPALLDKVFLGLLITGDLSLMRIMRSYYNLLRSFTTEMKDKVWFLEGVSNVLPVDVEQYSGGGGMHMMLDFLGGPSTLDVGADEDERASYAEIGNRLLNPDNLPSSVTNSMDIMQGGNDFMS